MFINLFPASFALYHYEPFCSNKYDPRSSRLGVLVFEYDSMFVILTIEEFGLDFCYLDLISHQFNFSLTEIVRR